MAALVAENQSGNRRRNEIMKKSTLLNIFLRSLTIQVSFNCRRMQNLGFAFSMLPMIREKGKESEDPAVFLARHLEMFNTHPYLASSVIGSVIRIEEDDAAPESAADLKEALMGPYAAIGDGFFWGALRTFSAVAAVLSALAGTLAAPFLFLLLYTPAHLWVRIKGFMEGYRWGRNGITFIKGLDLPKETINIRYGTVILVGMLAAFAVEGPRFSRSVHPGAVEWMVQTVLFVVAFAGVRRGISSVNIFYGLSALCFLFSI